VQVAVVASERQVYKIVATTVLTSDDVFDMKGDDRRGVLWQTAILALVGCRIPNRSAGCCIH
jgi:hypothetical protein